jgi:hypothetical protein
MQKSNPRIFGVACILVAIVAFSSLVGYSSYIGASSEKSSEATYHRLYGSTTVLGGNYSFSPPISKYEAINEAFRSDNLTASDLQNKTVYVSLNRVVYYNDTRAIEKLISKENITLSEQLTPNLYMTGSVFEVLGEVNASVDNYQPLITQGAYIRYVWTISIEKTGGMTIPPWGYYMVDAGTGELVPFPGHLF